MLIAKARWPYSRTIIRGATGGVESCGDKASPMLPFQRENESSG